jgi:hypothetical protein
MRMACLVELFVIFEGHEFDSQGGATLHTCPPARVDPSVRTEHYLVSGPQPLFQFGTQRKIPNFETWRLQKEGEGFYFGPLEV